LREIAWLQISDLHMRLRDEWSQDVVLSAMAHSIRQRRDQGLALDFILATGDLAFAGKKEEYALVDRFFDELVVATGVPKERIFCIPGNHDVNRDKQKLCFQGARATLTSPNAVDPVLSTDSDDLATLAQRQEAYRTFQASSFGNQIRKNTPDGLGYVSSLNIGETVVAIIGLNSAWIAEGGNSDHGNLLIGERQILNAFDILDELDAHIVIGIAHHPLHLLRDFDRNAAIRHITRRCHFYHCGHLHQPEFQGSGFDASACLMIAAGASFETREFQNAYSLVKLDLLAGTRTLTTVQYNAGQGEFGLSNEVSYPISLSPTATCRVDELAEAIAAFDETLASHSYYLAALLLEQKSDIPISGQGGHVFGALAVLRRLPEDDYCRKVLAFLRFRNALTIFFGRCPLGDILVRHGEAVKSYGVELLTRCYSDAVLADRLSQQDRDMRSLFVTQPKVSFTADLLTELALSQDWELLAAQAKRHLESSNDPTRIHARRMLALALAHSAELKDRDEAVLAYQRLIFDNLADVQDWGNLAALQLDLGRPDEAKAVVLQAIAASSPDKFEFLESVGQRIVGQIGDREFRKILQAALVKRKSHE